MVCKICSKTVIDFNYRFLYNPLTGKLFDMQSGREPGWVKHDGYRQISVKNKKYYAHRVVHLLMRFSWPKGTIDHINQVKDDNRWLNLRDTNFSGQGANKSGWGKSGYKGVWFSTQWGKWTSQLRYKGKVYSLGAFDCPKEAKKARDALAKNIHKEFFRA